LRDSCRPTRSRELRQECHPTRKWCDKSTVHGPGTWAGTIWTWENTPSTRAGTANKRGNAAATNCAACAPRVGLPPRPRPLAMRRVAVRGAARNSATRSRLRRSDVGSEIRTLIRRFSAGMAVSNAKQPGHSATWPSTTESTSGDSSPSKRAEIASRTAAHVGATTPRAVAAPRGRFVIRRRCR